MLGNMIGSFLVILIGVSAMSFVAEYSPILGQLLGLGLIIFVINILYSQLREEGLVKGSMWTGIRRQYHKMTGKEDLTGEKKELFNFQQFDKMTGKEDLTGEKKELFNFQQFDMMTLTGGMIIIIFTIFFLGAIDTKYDIGLTFDTAIEKPFAQMGETIGNTFTTLFQHIYHEGQENPETFFYLYIFIICFWIYNLLKNDNLVI